MLAVAGAHQMWLAQAALVEQEVEAPVQILPEALEPLEQQILVVVAAVGEVGHQQELAQQAAPAS